MRGLRPVEKLKLMAQAGMEEWSTVDALAAILAYLCYCGYAETVDGRVRLTKECGENFLRSKISRQSGILRDYEIATLELLRANDIAGIAGIAANCDFTEVFVAEGLARISPSKKRLGGKVIEPTDKLAQIMRDLVSDRAAAEKNLKIKAEQPPWMECYAFPSILPGNHPETEKSRLVFGEGAETTKFGPAAPFTAVAQNVLQESMRQTLAMAQALELTPRI